MSLGETQNLAIYQLLCRWCTCWLASLVTTRWFVKQGQTITNLLFEIPPDPFAKHESFFWIHCYQCNFKVISNLQMRTVIDDCVKWPKGTWSLQTCMHTPVVFADFSSLNSKQSDFQNIINQFRTSSPTLLTFPFAPTFSQRYLPSITPSKSSPTYCLICSFSLSLPACVFGRSRKFAVCRLNSPLMD